MGRLRTKDAAKDREPDAEPSDRAEEVSTPPRWVYTRGRIFRFLSFPFDLLYKIFITRTIVIGGEHLAHLSPPVILAGTHHSFIDVPLVREALFHSPAKHIPRRLVVATSVHGFFTAGLLAWYGVVAFGIFPIRRRGEGDGEASLGQIADLVQAGNSLLIFPEGRHARTEEELSKDELARFRPGVARLASRLNIPVLPFGLAGTEQAVPPAAEGFHGLVIAGIPVSLKRVPLAIAFDAPVWIGKGESIEAFTERLQSICDVLTAEAERALESLGGSRPAP